MPPNLKKSGSNSSGASQSSEGFSAPRKPSENAATQRGLNFTAERELGSAGGIKATGKLTVGVDNLIGQQGVQIEADASNRTLGIGLGVGSARGKLGVNINGKVGYDEQGKISIKGAEAGINIGGFGGSASIDDKKGISGSISVAGAKVEIAVTPDGKKSLSLCYGIPGGEICTTFEPDPGIKINKPGESIQSRPGVGAKVSEVINLFKNNCLYHVVYFQHGRAVKLTYSQLFLKTGEHEFFKLGTYVSQGDFISSEPLPTNHYSPSNIEWHDYPVSNNRAGYSIDYSRYYAQLVGFGSSSPGEISGNTAITYTNGSAGVLFDYGQGIKNWINNWVIPGAAWDFSIIEVSCIGSPPMLPKPLTPIKIEISPPTSTGVDLPNYPQILKPMDCCEEIKEIYKYLGIAKLKKKKMKLAKALMVPQGQGDEKLEDYYEIMESLFRVIANGGIFNPVSKPLGVEYQNVNATSWASEIYEMVAEAKSNGDSTQRFEMLASFQLVQMMKVLAEQRRMIECLSEAIGITPDLSTEEVPVMFTIHEAHKGFDKKQPKEIDISKAKTDDQVEAVLGKVFKPSKIPITKWVFNPNHISVSEAINKL